MPNFEYGLIVKHTDDKEYLGKIQKGLNLFGENFWSLRW